VSEIYTSLRDKSRERVGLEWRTEDHLALMERARELEAVSEDWRILAEKQYMEEVQRKQVTFRGNV
jgi:hypothetical protein